MAGGFLSYEVSDLTLGKPALSWLPLSASVADALKDLKHRDEKEISVWDCVPSARRITITSSSSTSSSSVDIGPAVEGASAVEAGADAWLRLRRGEGRCVGKICMLTIICYLSTDESLSNPVNALQAPLSVLLPEGKNTVRHIDSDASLLEALDLIADGVQNLVVDIEKPYKKFIKHPFKTVQKFSKKPAPSRQVSMPAGYNGKEYCWLTREDVVRFLLGFIGIFSPLPMMSIEDLGVINTNVLMVESDKDASSALKMIQQAVDQLSAVAVVEIDGEHSAKLVGEISSSAFQSCDETAALALATLPVAGFLSYTQDCNSPPEFLVEIMRSRICTKIGVCAGDDLSKRCSRLSYGAILRSQALEVWEESSDEDSGGDSPTGPHELSRRTFSRQFSGKGGYGTKSRIAPIVCRPWSSLVAVMVQTLAHRENYVWVTMEDSTLVGIVTFKGILAVLSNHLNSTG